jgi:hypothetical protein
MTAGMLADQHKRFKVPKLKSFNQTTSNVQGILGSLHRALWKFRPEKLLQENADFLATSFFVCNKVLSP